MRKDMLETAEAEYIRLLKIPFGAERMRNQRLMAFLRDYIAERSSLTSEQVQNIFEAKVYVPDLGEKK